MNHFVLSLPQSFFFNTVFILSRPDEVYSEKDGALLNALTLHDRPVCAALFPIENPEALEKISGQWTKLATVGQVTFWQRQP